MIDASKPWWQRWLMAENKQPCLVVGTKADLVEGSQLADHRAKLEQVASQLEAVGVALVSCQWPNSTEELANTISQQLEALEKRQSLRDQAGPLAVVHETAVRCRAALAAAQSGLQSALDSARSHGPEELIAAELRLVLDDLATIIGEVHSDDVLGEIFSRFCIGK